MLSIYLSVLRAGDGRVLAPGQTSVADSSRDATGSEYLSSDAPTSVSFSDEVSYNILVNVYCFFYPHDKYFII